MAIVRVGIDIATTVFQVHGVDVHGKTKLKKTLSRSEMLDFFARLPACRVGIEACAGAHYWARELKKLGHDVRLMASQFVIPYRKSGKNDANDAEAICEAVGRPNMRFVPVKTEEAQAVLTLHRARELLVAERSRLMQIEGIGPITASAMVANVTDAKLFKSGREFAAWLGLTPNQHSSGGKSRLGSITRDRVFPRQIFGSWKISPDPSMPLDRRLLAAFPESWTTYCHKCNMCSHKQILRSQQFASVNCAR